MLICIHMNNSASGIHLSFLNMHGKHTHTTPHLSKWHAPGVPPSCGNVSQCVRSAMRCIWSVMQCGTWHTVHHSGQTRHSTMRTRTHTGHSRRHTRQGRSTRHLHAGNSRHTRRTCCMGVFVCVYVYVCGARSQIAKGLNKTFCFLVGCLQTVETRKFCDALSPILSPVTTKVKTQHVTIVKVVHAHERHTHCNTPLQTAAHCKTNIILADVVHAHDSKQRHVILYIHI